MIVELEAKYELKKYFENQITIPEQVYKLSATNYAITLINTAYMFYLSLTLKPEYIKVYPFVGYADLKQEYFDTLLKTVEQIKTLPQYIKDYFLNTLNKNNIVYLVTPAVIPKIPVFNTKKYGKNAEKFIVINSIPKTFLFVEQGATSVVLSNLEKTIKFAYYMDPDNGFFAKFLEFMQNDLTERTKLFDLFYYILFKATALEKLYKSECDEIMAHYIYNYNMFPISKPPIKQIDLLQQIDLHVKKYDPTFIPTLTNLLLTLNEEAKTGFKITEFALRLLKNHVYLPVYLSSGYALYCLIVATQLRIPEYMWIKLPSIVKFRLPWLE